MQDREQLKLSRDEMRAMGYRVIDMLVEHFYELPQKPVTRKASRSDLENLLREPLPEEGMRYRDLLDQVKQDVLDNIMHLDHPRFFAFVPGPSNFVGVMADALASGFNVYAGTWLEGSGPAEIELVTVEWLRAACGLPEMAGGLFVSGGSMANLTALAVARHVRLGDRLEQAVLYCSDQTHSSIERALRVLGFAASQLRKVESDDCFRLNLTELRRAIEADRAVDLDPFCIIANAGTTNTGAVDPLPDLASFCQAEDLWLHIDGAYGAAAVLCERGKELLRGLGQADSVALDPHKWLFQPYEIGCVLVRDRRWLRQAFRILPEYLIDTQGMQDEVNFCDHGIQLTRSFRALKLWMSLKFFGWSAFERALNRGFELAELAEAVVREMDDWEVITPAEMAVVTFRYTPARVPCERLNHLNRELVRSMIEDGYALLTSTVLNDMVVLRICCINPRTTEKEIRDTLAKLDRMGRELG